MKKMKEPKKKCSVCGKNIPAVRAKNGAKYCSGKCKAKADAVAKKARREARKSTVPPVATIDFPAVGEDITVHCDKSALRAAIPAVRKNFDVDLDIDLTKGDIHENDLRNLCLAKAQSLILAAEAILTAISEDVQGGVLSSWMNDIPSIMPDGTKWDSLDKPAKKAAKKPTKKTNKK